MHMNFVQFGTDISPWHPRLQKLDDTSGDAFDDLLGWIRDLRCQGSTNTLAALNHALHDEDAEAIYLLTDGRPDQPPDAVSGW
jgi:hypothetical protein